MFMVSLCILFCSEEAHSACHPAPMRSTFVQRPQFSRRLPSAKYLALTAFADFSGRENVGSDVCRVSDELRAV